MDWQCPFSHNDLVATAVLISQPFHGERQEWICPD
jgi:hypothetical protein